MGEGRLTNNLFRGLGIAKYPASRTMSSHNSRFPDGVHPELHDTGLVQGHALPSKHNRPTEPPSTPRSRAWVPAFNAMNRLVFEQLAERGDYRGIDVPCKEKGVMGEQLAGFR